MMMENSQNTEVLHSSNASLRRVTVFSECSNTAGLIHIILDTARCVFVPQIAICTTKTLAPIGGLNHSKVVIKKQ